MDKNFETFKQFQDEAIALDIGQALTQAGIPCRIVSIPKMLDAQIIGTDSVPEYSLKVILDDFEAANEVLNNYFEKKIKDADKDYFIYSFTNEELKDVIRKPDEWGEYNYQLAKKILREKGVALTDETLKLFKEERRKELSNPETPGFFLYAGSVTIIMSSLLFLLSNAGGYQNLLRPLLAIFGYLIGRHIKNHKKVLPDGQVIKTYPQSDQRIGGIIEVICITLVVIGVIKFFLFVLGGLHTNEYE